MQHLLFGLLTALLFACTPGTDDENTGTPKISFRYAFDTQQERLDNFGNPSTIPAGHAAQTPDFEKLSVHVIDLSPDQFTPYLQGASVYRGAETTRTGVTAIDFDEAVVAEAGAIIHEMDLSEIPPGTYEYVRVSVSFQQYGLRYNINNLPVIGDLNQQRGTVASFLGYNTYIGSVQPKELSLDVDDDKPQGFWVFETELDDPYGSYDQISSGEAAGTTVVNPIAASSPIPPGSCVVTGKFAEPLVITGTETEDLEVTLSFSINNSFEWKDPNGNGEWDFYADDPSASEQVVDMGLRGLIPSY